MIHQIFLHPGDFFFAERAARIETILGSCVAITMRDPASGRAAMCHCLLPAKPAAGGGGVATDWGEFHYVDTCLEAMLAQFRARSIPWARLEIKMFGGANVMDVFSEKHAVGSLNWQQARRLLEALNLSVAAHDIGGKSGRRIVFETQTGEVRVKRLSAARRVPLEQF